MVISCYTCHEEITFNKKYLSKSGKQIPLYPDMKNTHSHDDDGKPFRGPLPGTEPQQEQPQYQPQPQQQQQQQQLEQPKQIPVPEQRDTISNSDLMIIVQANLVQTKAAVAMLDRITTDVTEIKNTVNKIFQKIEYNTQVDTEKLVGQLQTISDTIAPFLKAELKTASQLHKEETEKQQTEQKNEVNRPNAYSESDPNTASQD